jgi:hypothetical protein
MSETKHTPLPWHIDRRSMSICSEKNELVTGIGADSVDEWDANAKLIVTSVNARPQVEELVKCGRAALEHISLYRTGIQTGSHCDMGNAVPERLVEAILEVEAALGGKAE